MHPGDTGFFNRSFSEFYRSRYCSDCVRGLLGSVNIKRRMLVSRIFRFSLEAEDMKNAANISRLNEREGMLFERSRQAALRLVGVAPEEISRTLVPLLADCCDVCEIDGALLFVVNEGQQSIPLHQYWKQDGSEMPSRLSGAYKSSLREAILAGEPYEIGASRFSASPEGEEALLFQRVNLGSILSVPLKRDESILGSLAFVRHESGTRWTDAEWSALDEFASIFTRLLSRLSPVTKRIQELRALVGGDAENIFHVVIDSLNEGVSCCTNEGYVIYCNPSWERITGYSLEETKGKRIYEFLFPPMNIAYDRLKSRQHERYEERRRGIPEEYETEIVRKDGRKAWIQVKASPLRNNDWEIVGSIGIITDISERKTLETQILWSQKIGAIGRIVQGFTNEFHSTISLLQSCEQAFSSLATNNEAQSKAIEALHRATHAAEHIGEQLKGLDEEASLSFVRFSLSEWVLGALETLKVEVPSSLVLQTHVPSSRVPVEGDRTSLFQVLRSILMNAVESYDSFGEMHLKVESQRIERSQFSLQSGLRPGQYAVLSLQDFGCGMSEEEKANLFEPFFSTKEGHLGLGLVSAYGIVRQHNGVLLIESELGRGTVVRMYLPLVEGESEKE